MRRLRFTEFKWHIQGQSAEPPSCLYFRGCSIGSTKLAPLRSGSISPFSLPSYSCILPGMQEKQRLREAIRPSLWGCDFHKPILPIQYLLVCNSLQIPLTISLIFFFSRFTQRRNIMVPIPYHPTFLPFSLHSLTWEKLIISSWPREKNMKNNIRTIWC